MTPRTSPWHRHWPRGFPHALAVPQSTLFDHLATSAARYPQRPAIVYYDSVLTYADFLAQAEALAGHLQRAGVAQGDRVLLMSQNCPQFSIAFFAIQRCGAVVVPVNAMCTAGEVDHYLEDSGARHAVAAQELLPAMAPALQRGVLREVVVICYADALTAPTALNVPEVVRAPRQPLDQPGCTAWATALAGAPAPPVAVKSGDLAVLPYTSGTTGRPKGCMHTHQSLTASSTGAALWRGLHAESVVLGVAPLFHLLGLQNALLMPVWQGATVVMLARWDAAAAAALIERYRVSVWASPPAMLIDFFAHPEAQRRDLSSLAMLNGGGAAMPEAVSAMLKERFGITYIEGYGLTETASFLHCNPLQASKRQCLGIPTFGVHSRIVDPETLAELPVGETGELVTRGAQVMQGYWRDEAANRAAFMTLDGERYFRTGDLAAMDADGYFFMRDRLKRMINVSGYKVWPAEVESMLYEHAAIHEACIVARPDAKQGESVCAVVVLRPGHALDEAALIAWCRERMAVYKAPRAVEFRAALPKSNTGKVAWREIQEAYARP
ncbi:long-chain-fatty-acid--CoA ligase [Pseudorhodoferax sp. Leaf267]|uniref:long-chain-fatty-acid--CoA ligase n=1 Tax=Pseudorhodoferax sp. Leaf267 TaxID=1736316 RepID=UPI0006F1FEF8|nr:long-chain-fatty-acid--CoA ligase [Pseudorhodoferax sp. Leaf267]KQP13584.1 long-chain fatty acid--CoA ligase [Pseudorhodoferax sp. Leaf267]